METDPLFTASVANGITAIDTAIWNNHTIDTQLDLAGVAALVYVAGPHTVDTKLDSSGIAALGFVPEMSRSNEGGRQISRSPFVIRLAWRDAIGWDGKIENRKKPLHG